MTSSCGICSKKFKNKRGLTMHKRMAHPVTTDQADDTNKSSQVNATPEQLEDLRNFVASLVNSLASHAGVLFNSIRSERTE